MAYLLNSDVGSYLNVDLDADGQAMVDALIANFSDVVDNYCNRTWRNTNPIVEKFDANTDTFFVSQPKVTSVDSVVVAGVTVDPQYIYNYGTYIKIFLMPQVFALPLFTFRQAVTITYETNAVVANFPKDIKQALIQWIAREFQKAPDGGRETYEQQAGSVRQQFAPSKTSVEASIPPFVKMVLNSYRVIPMDHF